MSLVDTKSRVRAIWADILGLDTVNESDNFFALGGDSIRAMAMLFRIEQELFIFVDPGDLFECPTLQEFSSQLQKIIADTAPS